MVGNDIIDIQLATSQSNWQRPRYLDKLFTTSEQELIRSSDNATHMVWRLWSMKEAAYKLYTQLNPSRFYNPKAFKCFIVDTSYVRYKSFRCEVNTQHTKDYIISVARLDNRQPLFNVIEFREPSHTAISLATQKQVIQLFSNQNNCAPKEVTFIKSEFGIPFIQYKSERYNVSLSHHGRFGAVAIT